MEVAEQRPGAAAGQQAGPVHDVGLSTGRIRSQCGAMSRSWHSPISAAISASDSRGRAASSRALSGHGCPSHTRCRLARTAAAGVARSRASSAPNSGILASGAGTRNSG